MSPEVHPFDAMCAVFSHALRGREANTWLKDVIASDRLNDTSWVTLASRHRAVPALCACLDDLGLLPLLPGELHTYLMAMRASNATRNQLFLDEMGDIVRRLNAVGVEPCLLKGATRLVDGLYPNASWRFMTDLDLLVPEPRLNDCNRVLHEAGYVAFNNEHPLTHHCPALWHPEREAIVELHWHTTPRKSLLSTSRILARSQSVSGIFGCVRILHPEDQVALLIAHAQIFDGYAFYGLVRLSDLIELDRLATSYELDWPRIVDNFTRLGWNRSCMTFLWAAKALLETPLPTHLNFDPIMRLSVRRCIWQQYWRPAMMTGIYAGWLVPRSTDS